MRYLIKISYDGTNYHGWQIQINANSVQGVLNKCLEILLKNKIETIGCGRTDTGVHAENFYAHFDSENIINDNEKFLWQLNNLLPNDIYAKSINCVSDNFHCRFDAKQRTYQYFINKTKNPFNNNYAVNLTYKLDVEKMNEAAKLLFNYSDFSCFCKLGTDTKTNICKIYNCHWIETNEQYIFTITADRFLRNMVRAIVGTLIDIGASKISLNKFIEIIESKDRSKASASVLAKGLFLTDIVY